MLTEQLTWQDTSGAWFTPRMAVLNALIEAGLGDAIPNGCRQYSRPSVVLHPPCVHEHAFNSGKSRPAWAALKTREERLEYIWEVLNSKSEES